MFQKLLCIAILLGASSLYSMQNNNGSVTHRINQAVKKAKKQYYAGYSMYAWPIAIGVGGAVAGYLLWDRYPQSPMGPIVGAVGVGLAHRLWNIKKEEIQKNKKIENIKNRLSRL